MSFSDDERERYARHIMLKEIGGPGQQRLKAATVAIIGAGGLGAPAALYLAAAGVGSLRLIDHDEVSLSNLQRQILYRGIDVGAPKVERAREALSALNPHVEIETFVTRLYGPPAPSPASAQTLSSTGSDRRPNSAARSLSLSKGARATRAGEDASGPHNALALLQGATLVLDGTDDFATRFAVNAACHELRLTLISGAVGRWQGQVATFRSGPSKHLPPDQRLPCYRCFVPEMPPDAETCAAVGIVGALTGVIGSMMALEAIKEITDAGEGLAGRMLLYDGLAGSSRSVTLKRDPACPVCGGA